MSQELIRFIELTLRALIGGALIIGVIVIAILKRLTDGQDNNTNSDINDPADGGGLD